MSGAVADQLAMRESEARELDSRDSLASERELFHLPTNDAGEPFAYFTGNSLGLQPKSTRAMVDRELDDWAALGVEGHHDAKRPWVSYHELAREKLARLVGATPREVVAMNTLTVNLHLLMVSFYRPTSQRFRIVIEDSAFPSDSYAVDSQARFHGFDPADAIVRLKPRDGEHAIRTEDIETLLEREGDSIALIMLGGVNYLTGQWFDMERITRAGQNAGCVVGWDLAHAAGNVPLKLHDWNADFAAWCHYKYVNSGPGAAAGAFVHERHWNSGATDLPRFEGWWGHDPDVRFKMEAQFVAAKGADAWQLSNPPIFSLAPVLASLEIFDRVGMDQLREKSLAMTGFLESLLDSLESRVSVLTPRDPAQRGCQLSMVVEGGSRETHSKLREAGVVCDFREPNVIRAAPVPLYNTCHDCWRLANALATIIR